MERLIDNGILYLLGVFLLAGTTGWVRPVIVALVALIVLALLNYLESETMHLVIAVVMVAAGFWMPALFCFLPLIGYDIMMAKQKWCIYGESLAAAVGTFYELYAWHSGKNATLRMLLWIFAMAFAGFFAYRTRTCLKQKDDYIHLKDSSTELRLVMQKRQQELMEKQDYEIHLATLQERNRIAREIHDNVGHMLSRAILQMGALQTIHKEEPLHSQLLQVNDTLGEAMNNIRESVHDLHNESLDLHQAFLDLCKELEEKYEMQLHYDMSADIPRSVKYCFVAIAKEAMANVVRHSNASAVTIFLCEHPGFYQMSVEDNGSGAHVPDAVKEGKDGIGLANMRDRVEALHGTISFFADRGFRILLSIPKERQQ